MSDSAARLDRAIERQTKVGDIAEWYRGQPWLDDIKRHGGDVLISVDHMNRIIRVTSEEGASLRRKPIEERMEFDKDVLELLRKHLEATDHVVVLDTADIPGRIGSGTNPTRGLSARVSTIEIDSGEYVDEEAIVKEKPEFPDPLKRKLVALPALTPRENVLLRTYTAERFVGVYLYGAAHTADSPETNPALREQRPAPLGV